MIELVVVSGFPPEAIFGLKLAALFLAAAAHPIQINYTWDMWTPSNPDKIQLIAMPTVGRAGLWTSILPDNKTIVYSMVFNLSSLRSPIDWFVADVHEYGHLYFDADKCFRCDYGGQLEYYHRHLVRNPQ